MTFADGQPKRAVAWRGAQLALVRGLAFVRLLALASLVGPEAFGLWAIALAAVNTLATVSELGLIPALVQRAEIDDDQRAAAWTVGLGRAAVIAAGLALAAPWVASLFDQPRAAPWIALVAARPLIEAAASIRVADLQRSLAFRALFAVHGAGAVVETLVAVGLAWWAPEHGVRALVVGLLAGAATQVVVSYGVAPWRPRLSLDLGAARPLVHYGRWVLASGIVSTLGGVVLQAVIARRLGTEALGVYHLAMKVAFLPSELASTVVGAVAFPVFARLQDQLDRVADAFRRTLQAVGVVLVPVHAALWLAAPILVELLGERWQGTAPVLRWLLVVGVVGLFGDVAVPLFQGLGRPQWVTALEAVQSATLIALAAWLTVSYGVVGAAWAWLVAIGLSQFLAIERAGRLLGRMSRGVSS